MGCNAEGCPSYKPNSGGVTFKQWSYPTIDSGIYWPDVDRNAVMYPSVLVSGESTEILAQPTYCGKQYRVDNTSPFGFGGYSGTTTTWRVFGHVPTGLSMFPLYSDRWFAYQWDTTDSFVGTPCKVHREIKETTTTTNSSTTTSIDPETLEEVETTTTTQTSSDRSYWECDPCTSSDGTCVPIATDVTYSTPEGNISGDSAQPYPTIYTATTTRNNIVFKYNSFVTTQQNSVDSLTITIDGNTYDAWSNEATEGKFASSQGNWNQDDWQSEVIEQFTDANGLRYTIRIEPIITDYTNDVYTFGGSNFSIIEISNYGSGYTVGDSISGSYTFTHSDDSTTAFSWSIAVTGTTSREVAAGASGTLLSAGETLNGHTVVDVFHTDIDNFIWHVAVLNGGGSNFTKDGSYTSSSGQNISVAAGYGIKERAMIVGLYEFRGKEIQYVTAQLDPEVPHYYDDMVDPDVTATISNGTITALTITNGGSGWDKLGRKPVLAVSEPTSASGRTAVIEGKFSGGSLQSVKIIDGGSGYSSSSPPTIAIGDVSLHETEVNWKSIGDPKKDPALNLLKEVDEVNDQNKYSHITEVKSAEIDFTGVSNTVSDQKITGFFVKYTRPNNYTVEGVNYTVKGTSKQWSEKFFGNEEDANEFVEDLKRQKYDYTIEKIDGKLFSDYVKEQQTQLQSELSEVQVGKVTKIDPSETTDQKKLEKMREDVFDERTGTKKTVLVQSMRTNPDVKRNISLPKSKFSQSSIDEIPRTTESSKDIFGNHPIKGVDEQLQKSLDMVKKLDEDLLDKPTSVQYDEVEITTVRISFSRLPCPSRFVKYYIRQYIPDKSTKTSMNVSLSCTIAGVTCADYCTLTGTAPGGSSSGNVSYTYTLLNEYITGGCASWTASGSVTIYNDMTGAANLFADACNKFGNPFDSLCD